MEIKKRETIYNGFFTFKKLHIEDKGEMIEREQLDVGRVAAALVYDTAQDKYILVKQYRYQVEQTLLEVVAGLVENEQNNPEQTIRKEIEEETGYAVDKIESVLEFYPSPGSSTEKVYLFYAEVSQKKAAGGGLVEEHEDIKVATYSLEELLQLPVQDGKSIIAIQWLANKKSKPMK